MLFVDTVESNVSVGWPLIKASNEKQIFSPSFNHHEEIIYFPSLKSNIVMKVCVVLETYRR